MKEPLVAMIITNLNGASIGYENDSVLNLCLKTLKNTNYHNYKVIVGDDHSTDNSREVVKKAFPYADFVANKASNRLLESTNEMRMFRSFSINNGAASNYSRGASKDKGKGIFRSFSTNNNTAIRYAFKKYHPDYIVILNNDVVFTDKNWLSHMVKIAESDEKIGIVSPKLLWPDGRVQSFIMRFGDRFSLRNLGRGDAGKNDYNSIREVEVMAGVALLVKRTVLEKIGLLDENYLSSYEDVDFCLRTRAKGFKIIYDAKAKVVHLAGFTRKLVRNDADMIHIINYANQRNRFYFLRKHKDKCGFGTRMMWYLLYFGDGMFDIDSKKGEVGLMHIKLRSHPIRRFSLTLKALRDSRKLIPSDKPFISGR